MSNLADGWTERKRGKRDEEAEEEGGEEEEEEVEDEDRAELKMTAVV